MDELLGDLHEVSLWTMKLIHQNAAVCNDG